MNEATALSFCEPSELEAIKLSAKTARVIRTAQGPAVLIGDYAVGLSGSPAAVWPDAHLSPDFWAEVIAALLRGDA